MKKTVNGKRYDTEKAELIYTFSRGNYSDFNYISESLYKTGKGAWFIHGEGGANSKYSKSNGNSSSGSEDLVPISADEAFEWLQENDATEMLDTHFSERIEEA